MITAKKIFATVAVGLAAVALSGCQIDTRTPIRVSQILEVAKSGVPSPVAATITGQFITPAWCQDEAVMAAQAVATPAVPVQVQSCAAGGPTGAWLAGRSPTGRVIQCARK